MSRIPASASPYKARRVVSSPIGLTAQISPAEERPSTRDMMYPSAALSGTFWYPSGGRVERLTFCPAAPKRRLMTARSGMARAHSRRTSGIGSPVSSCSRKGSAPAWNSYVPSCIDRAPMTTRWMCSRVSPARLSRVMNPRRTSAVPRSSCSCLAPPACRICSSVRPALSRNRSVMFSVGWVLTAKRIITPASMNTWRVTAPCCNSMTPDAWRFWMSAKRSLGLRSARWPFIRSPQASRARSAGAPRGRTDAGE